MKLKATNYNILVKIIRQNVEKTTESGIVITDNDAITGLAKGQILDIGPKVEEKLNVGDIIYFPKYVGTPMVQYEIDVISITPDKVMCKENKDG